MEGNYDAEWDKYLKILSIGKQLTNKTNINEAIAEVNRSNNSIDVGVVGSVRLPKLKLPFKIYFLR